MNLNLTLFWEHIFLLFVVTVLLYNFNFIVDVALRLKVILSKILDEKKYLFDRYLSFFNNQALSFRQRVEDCSKSLRMVLHLLVSTGSRYTELWRNHVSLSANAFIAYLKKLKCAVKEYDSRFEGAAKRNPKTAFMLGEFFSRPVGWMMGILLMAYQGEKVRGFVDWVVDGVRVYGDCVIEVVFIYGEFVIEVVRVYVNCLIEVLRVFIAWVISFFF
jgi:hypothetical protein